MKNSWVIVLALAFSELATAASAADQPKAGPPAWPAIVNRIRFFPAPKRETAMVGGKFSGSNESATDGFKTLAEITTAPVADQWNEMAVTNDKPYRWLRYEAPAGSHGDVAEIEFLAGQQRIDGIPERSGDGRKAFDHDTKTQLHAAAADQQFATLDTWDRASTRSPLFRPAPVQYADPQDVVLFCPTAGAEIRYTLDGTTPTSKDGLVYKTPIHMDQTTTLVATAVKDGLAVSPPAWGTFLVGSSAKPGFHTFHIGNSLTGTTGQFERFARTAGYDHKYLNFTMGGAWTNKLWNIGLVEKKADWEKSLAAMPKIDHFSVQPRDFNIPEEADYDIRFFNLIRQHSPDMQPWIYVEWVERQRQRPTDKAAVPSRQMTKLFPAETWEESMSAMLLYAEDLQQQILDTYHEGKRPRIIPSCLAMGWIYHMIERGKVPGMPPGSFYPELFFDAVHPNFSGGYLVDLTWFSAFYRESPEGKVLPVSTTVTPEQATVMQQLAWNVIQNYPDCGLYEDGTTPAGKPEFSAAATSDITPVTLTSTTPGAWFRYTLDGTPPTRTRGYVYCGVISARPGMTVKAIAYKSGLADSPASELTLPTSQLPKN